MLTTDNSSEILDSSTTLEQDASKNNNLNVGNLVPSTSRGVTEKIDETSSNIEKEK